MSLAQGLQSRVDNDPHGAQQPNLEMSAQGVLAIVLVLARYLRAHPAASDSLEGIARWWFDGEEDPLIDEVNEALHQLVRHGGMQAFVAADGRTRYAMASGAPALDAAVVQIATEASPPFAPDSP